MGLAFRNPSYGADGGNVAAAPPAGFCPGIDGVSALSGSGVVASAGGVVAAAVKNLARRIRHNTSSSVTHKNKIMAGVTAGSGRKILATALRKNIKVKNPTMPMSVSNTMSSLGLEPGFLLGFWGVRCGIFHIV